MPLLPQREDMARAGQPCPSSAKWTAAAQENGYGSTQVQTSEKRHT
jgi:hypothetical protein